MSVATTIACAECGAELGVPSDDWHLEHHDDDSHTAHPPIDEPPLEPTLDLRVLLPVSVWRRWERTAKRRGMTVAELIAWNAEKAAAHPSAPAVVERIVERVVHEPVIVWREGAQPAEGDMTPSEIAAARELVRSGLSRAAVGRLLGRSDRTISNHTKDLPATERKAAA